MSPKQNKAQKPTTHQNVRLTVATKAKLTAFAKKGESYDALIERILRDIERVNFEILLVDNESPTNHSVTYIIGNAKYVFAKGKHALVSVP